MKLRVLLAAAAVTLGLIAAPAVTQHVTAKPVADTPFANTLIWPGRKSLTSYVDGNVTLSDGVYRNANDKDSFIWPFAGSDYNEATKTGSVNFKGKVDWNHVGHGFHLTISNPTFKLTNGKAQLVADVTLAVNGGETTQGRDAYWDLELASTWDKDGELGWYGTPKVTEAGAKVFQKWYGVGDAWDAAAGRYTKK
ncbi:hypothetical protein D5S17_11995 [Pseudonocardiaceae bacterium YIM PH 21723]|nr:hypothetical protein D5S17_11995 [Pseudonocardiaceae bacterium YIM PH 21723]